MSDEEAAPAQGGSQRLIIIILSVLVALMAGGGGMFFALGGKHAESAGSAGEGGHGEPVKAKGPAIYIKLDPPFVVNFQTKGLLRFLQVTIEVLTRDPATAEMVKQNDPMIRNDLLMLLGSQQLDDIDSREGKEQLRTQALQIVANIVTAEGGKGHNVEQLFFTSFVMQ